MIIMERNPTLQRIWEIDRHLEALEGKKKSLTEEKEELLKNLGKTTGSYAGIEKNLNDSAEDTNKKVMEKLRGAKYKRIDQKKEERER